MNLLFPRWHPNDAYLASDVSGRHSVSAVGNGALFVGAASSLEVPPHHKTGLPADEYTEWYGGILDGLIEKWNIDCIYPSCATDMILPQIGRLNDKYGLPGITEDQAAFFHDKALYLEFARSVGIDVPEIYEIVPAGEVAMMYDYEYPVICKPVRGSGSKGVYVSKSEENHRWFFGPSDRPDDFAPRTKMSHDRLSDGSLRNYLYHAEGGAYMVQEYVQGQCFSLGGTVVNGDLFLDCLSRVLLTPFPYRAEAGYVSFGRVREVMSDAVRHLTTKLRKLPFPDGAWRADCIWTTDHRLSLIDLSPRVCTIVPQALQHLTPAGEESYGIRVARASSMGAHDGSVHRKISDSVVKCEVLQLPKGRIKSIAVSPDVIMEVEDYDLPDAIQINEPRNDLQSWARGWVLAMGHNEFSADQKIHTFKEALECEME